MGVGRILEQIVVGESDHVTQLTAYPITAALLDEEALETSLRDRGRNLLRIYTLARLLQHVRRQFTGKHLQQWLIVAPAGVLEEQHGEGIRLLSRGTADRPDAHARIVIVLAIENLA